MDTIRRKIKELSTERKPEPKIDADTLKDYGLEDITLRDYQLDGVRWLAEHYHRHHGCVLADEMGLGKTCQTIGFLVYLKGCGESSGPHLIISPLSVMANWSTELKRFAPSFKVLIYVGNKDERPKLQHKMKSKNYNIVLSTYEFSWHTLVVDEAHRLKNRKSLLHQTLIELDVRHTILLTGTPVQNNLDELYSLLSFVAGDIFKEAYLDDFVNTFSGTGTSSNLTELHHLLRPFLFRRIKTEVIKDLPKKSEIILYHGLSALQKKYYKALLTKDIEVFENPNSLTKTRLLNILMQLRKCVNHPYLFDGVEPEPFQMGEHLVTASGKLIILDQLLSYLQAQGHKVLIFSQMTHMLDILQDYLGYRGYSYERLDGSVRGEERYLAVQNFNENDDTFVFLLSTRAGGQGLNLVAADTVIFIDSDFNPQNDLQAAARAHRIGQTRGVKVIRLIGRSTVEEIVLARALTKLKLTQDVIEGGQFSTASDKTSLIADNAFELQDILKFGLDQLFTNEDSTIEDVDLEAILGKSKDGEWQTEDDSKRAELDVACDVKPETVDISSEAVPSSVYIFEGTDYRNEPTAEDKKIFNQLLADQMIDLENGSDDVPALRKNNKPLSEPLTRKLRKPLTPEEREARKQKIAETMARRAKEAEEMAKRRKEQKQKKKEERWLKNGYTSHKVTLDEDENELSGQSDDQNVDVMISLSHSDDEDDGRQSHDLRYVVGDVTKPQHTNGDKAIIVHCLDDSGYWGRGGLFTAIGKISPGVQRLYEFAGEMDDLHLGDVHLVPMETENNTEHQLYCALVIAQHRDKKNNLSGIKLTALDEALHKIHKAATDMKASVHLPRIGHNTPGFNWYGTERLIRKHLSAKGIPTYIYYFPRRHSLKRKLSTDSSDSELVGPSDKDKSKQIRPESSRASTSKPQKSESVESAKFDLSGVRVHFHKVSPEVVTEYSQKLKSVGGDVNEVMSETTTHVLVDPDLPEDQQDELLTIVEDYSHVPVLTLSWLTACLKENTKLPTGDYLFG